MMMRLDCYQAKRLLACNQDAKLVRKMIIKYNTNVCMCMPVCVSVCLFVCIPGIIMTFENFHADFYGFWRQKRAPRLMLSLLFPRKKGSTANLLINLWQCVEAVNSRGGGGRGQVKK